MFSFGFIAAIPINVKYLLIHKNIKGNCLKCVSNEQEIWSDLDEEIITFMRF